MKYVAVFGAEDPEIPLAAPRVYYRRMCNVVFYIL